jgi:uncharacterized protein YrzB (UPF0473 family)
MKVLFIITENMNYIQNEQSYILENRQFDQNETELFHYDFKTNQSMKDGLKCLTSENEKDLEELLIKRNMFRSDAN